MKPLEKWKPSAMKLFVEEWRQQNGHSLSWPVCCHMAIDVWKILTPENRQPYRDKAQTLLKFSLESRGLSNNAKESRLQHVKVDDPEEQQRHMQQQIEHMVRRSVQLKKLDKEDYYFVMVNCFAKDIYIPAELAIAQFSLQGGVHRIFHTLINPGCNVYGSLCEAQEHTKDTHQLPLPPNALGNTDLEGVYADILQFLGPDPLQLFTLQDAIPIVTGVLKFLNTESSQLNILPIEYLFYKMKQASCETAMLSPPESIHVTNSLFNLDLHECLPHIACTFHEERVIPKHCAKSYVTRWAFTFAKNICSDLEIKMCPIRHMPETLKANQSGNESLGNENVDHETSIIKVEPSVDDEVRINPFVVNAINDLGLDNIFDDVDFFEFNNRYNEKETEASIKHQTENVALEKADPIPLVKELSPPAPPVITAQELNDDCEFFPRQREKQQKHKVNSKNYKCQEIIPSLISEPLHDSKSTKEKYVLHRNSKNVNESQSRIDNNHRSRKRTKSRTEINRIPTAHLSNSTMPKKLMSTIVTTGANLLTSPTHPRTISSRCNYTYNTYHYDSFTTYECCFEPQAYFEHQHCDQYEYCQPVRRSYDVRHHLKMRSQCLPQDGFGHRIQRRYNLEPGQMHTYSDEQFQMREYNSSEWGGYKSRYKYQNYHNNAYD